MKKMLSTLFAACVTAASVSLADADPDTYAVIDLSGGPAAASYPVSYMSSEPVGGWTNDLSYVTNKLVLRKIVETNGNFYYMGVFELTWGQVEKIADSGVGNGDDDNRPVSALDAFQYSVMTTALDSLNAKVGLFVDFPTEAQWEYACRAGTTNQYHFGDAGGTDDPASLGDYAWFEDNSGGAVNPVGQKSPNPWGLYDLYGNVAELCQGDGSDVRRGGGYDSPAEHCTSTSVAANEFEPGVPRLGYRLCARLPLLTVIGGTGGGNFFQGTTNTVEATVPDHHTFSHWEVDPPSVTNALGLGADFSATNATTVVVMPLADVTLTAVIVPNLYPLTVENGSGSGSYTNGQIVTITANPTNTLLFEFTGWANAVNVAVAEPTNATTTVTMLGGDASVTATYGDKRYTLTVNFATGDGNYTNGQTVTIGATTTPPTAEHEFDHWEGDTATVADVNSAPTTFTMPATNVTLTAVFRPKLKPQNTFLTLDLSDNSVSYSDAPPAGGWTGLHKTTQMVFRKIPAGSFIMGSASGQANETPHSVTLTKDFYLGIFEVTQKQWEEIRGGTPPSYFSGDTLPVERVYYSDIRGNNLGKGWPANNQVDADSFMGRLRLKNAAVGAADLPTEAQWEYACRAGTTGDYAGPLDALAWYAANSTNRTQVVGSKQPNPWGLYDMHGNVWEICLDWYTATPGSAAQTDPPGTLPLRVKRGGAYNAPAAELRSAVRWNVIATNQLAGGGSITNLSIPNGFRVAVPQATASFALTVINGTVNTGGVFAAGTTIGLSPAPAPAGMKFGVWQVNPAGLDLGAGFVPSQAQPLLTMPASALTVEAIYIPEASAGLFRFVQNGPGGSVERWRAEGDGFTITAPAPEPGYKFSSWTVTPTGADLGAGFAATAATTTVLMPAMDVAVTPEYVLDVPDFTPETPTAGVAFMLDAGQGQRPATFSASGLPRGLRIDRETGVISGVPSKPGTYTVTVTAQRANGNSTSYTLAFTVQALDPALQGTFTGYCYEEEGGQCRIRGLVTFKATSLGRLTAKVVLQAVNLSFSAKSWSGVSGDSDYLAAMARRQGEQLDVTVDAATGFLTGTLSGGRVGAETLLVTAQRNAFLDRLNITAQTILAAYKGYYTVALPIEACETDPAIDNRQSGSGYVTITVRDRGAVKVAGKMADGTRVSLSSTLLVDDQGADVPLFVKLYGRRGIFAGLLHIGGGAYPATQRVGEVPDVRLEWLYPGSTMAGLADRFDAQLSALGAYYDAVGDLQAAYAGKILQAEGMEWAMPLAAGRSPGSLTVDPVIENPQAVKFKAARRTGLFSGSFRVMNEAGRNVTLKYVGVLTRLDDAYVGDGAYVEKRSANGRSVKSSYRVWIEAPHPQ